MAGLSYIVNGVNHPRHLGMTFHWFTEVNALPLHHSVALLCQELGIATFIRQQSNARLIQRLRFHHFAVYAVQGRKLFSRTKRTLTDRKWLCFEVFPGLNSVLLTQYFSQNAEKKSPAWEVYFQNYWKLKHKNFQKVFNKIFRFFCLF